MRYPVIWLICLVLLSLGAGCSPANPLTPAAGPANTESPTTGQSDAGATRVPVPGSNPTAAATRAGNAKTFANPAWHIAVDYPSDWTVQPDATGATFTAPDGATVRLTQPNGKIANPGSLMPDSDLPNTRCSLNRNTFGLPARVCLDTIARVYTAEVLVPTYGLVTLNTGGRPPGDIQSFNVLVASIRPQ